MPQITSQPPSLAEFKHEINLTRERINELLSNWGTACAKIINACMKGLELLYHKILHKSGTKAVSIVEDRGSIFNVTESQTRSRHSIVVPSKKKSRWKEPIHSKTDDIESLICQVFDQSSRELSERSYVNERSDEETENLIRKSVFEGAKALTTEEFYEVNHLCRVNPRWKKVKVLMVKQLIQEKGI